MPEIYESCALAQANIYEFRTPMIMTIINSIIIMDGHMLITIVLWLRKPVKKNKSLQTTTHAPHNVLCQSQTL